MTSAGHSPTILYLSSADSYHTKKWARWFSDKGYTVHVASLQDVSDATREELPAVTFHWLGSDVAVRASDIQKLGYLKSVSAVRGLVGDLDPDIVHVHYVSSYGLICSFACNRPYYLSMWGSDVYEFPQRSVLHRSAVKRSLKHATWLMSTSEAMAEEAHKYTEKPIDITPFGVDMELFCPLPEGSPRHDGDGFVVGTVKGLEKKYDIDTLIRGCALLCERRPDLGLRLRIAGKGSMEDELKALAESLGMRDRIDWLGFIPQEQVVRELRGFDVATVTSESESFGVSAVEAQACGTPLVITDIPGLEEVTDGGRTALVVPRKDSAALADALEALADDPVRRARMSREGREYVASTYELGRCFEHVEDIYLSNLRGQ